MALDGKFLTTVGEHAPVIMCERHAQVFEIAMMANEIPHTIYELDDDDGPYYCHVCDLQTAKAYAKRVDEATAPKIIRPGDLH